MPDGLRLALTTFTIAPVRGPSVLDRRTAGTAMALAPLVGLLLGVVAGGIVYALRTTSYEVFVTILPATAAIIVLALLTRGLHLDGLADTADGLASYKPPQQALQVMREPAVGALGVVTLLLVLLGQVAALSACAIAGRGTASALLAVAVGRLAATAACVPPTPAASSTGLGALVAGTASRAVVVVWTGLLVVLFAGYQALDEGTSDATRAVNAGRVVVAVAVALLVAGLLRRHCVRRLGGVNGDVLGALIEVTTLVVLVVMSLELPAQVRP